MDAPAKGNARRLITPPAKAAPVSHRKKPSVILFGSARKVFRDHHPKKEGAPWKPIKTANFPSISTCLIPPVQPETHRKEYAYAMLSNVGSDNPRCPLSVSTSTTAFSSPPARGVRPVLSPDQHCGDAPSGHLPPSPTRWGWTPACGASRGPVPLLTPAYNRYPQQLPALLQNAIQGELAAIGKIPPAGGNHPGRQHRGQSPTNHPG